MRFDPHRSRRPILAKFSDALTGVQREYAYKNVYYRPTAYSSNENNELASLKARVLADTPTAPDLNQCVEWIWANINVILPRMHHIQSVSFEEYIRRSNAAPSVKKLLQETKLYLDSIGVSETSTLSRSQIRQWVKRSAFVKVENNLYQSRLGVKSPEKTPRCIQGAKPEFICLVGPWMMAFQDVLKRRWSTKFSICFSSGLSSEQMADYIANALDLPTGIVEDDISAFDASVRRPWLELEYDIFKRASAPKAVLALVAANIDTNGYTAHGWHYKCRGTRKSGDPYTSSGNSLINGFAHLFLVHKHTNLSCATILSRIRMLVQGNDNALVLPKHWRVNFKSGMLKLGFKAEALWRTDYDELEFCSNRMYKTSTGWVFGPKPGRVIAKFGYLVNPPPAVSRESMLKGICLGLYMSCHFIAPLKCLLDHTLRLCGDAEPYFERRTEEHRIKVDSFHEATVETPMTAYIAYGWTPSNQKEWELQVSKLRFGDPLPGIAELLMDADVTAPQIYYH
jgi:hypothetical protein